MTVDIWFVLHHPDMDHLKHRTIVSHYIIELTTSLNMVEYQENNPLHDAQHESMLSQEVSNLNTVEYILLIWFIMESKIHLTCIWRCMSVRPILSVV